MILLLDVGNTRVKWAWLEHLDVAPAGAVAHDATRRSWQREIEADGHRPRRIVVASVAGPAFAAALTLWSRDHYRIEPELLAARAEQCGVRNAYARPAALGVDRWLALIGAWRNRALPTLVVSSGTALTVDALDGGGQHRGGLIVPGVQMMRDARALRRRHRLPARRHARRRPPARRLRLAHARGARRPFGRGVRRRCRGRAARAADRRGCAAAGTANAASGRGHAGPGAGGAGDRRDTGARDWLSRSTG